MLDLLESTEFGDWLIAEISDAGEQSKTACPERSLAALIKLKHLKMAKKVFLEFLTIQKNMLSAAVANRRH